MPRLARVGDESASAGADVNDGLAGEGVEAGEVVDDGNVVGGRGTSDGRRLAEREAGQ